MYISLFIYFFIIAPFRACRLLVKIAKRHCRRRLRSIVIGKVVSKRLAIVVDAWRRHEDVVYSIHKRWCKQSIVLEWHVSWTNDCAVVEKLEALVEAIVVASSIRRLDGEKARAGLRVPDLDCVVDWSARQASQRQHLERHHEVGVSSEREHAHTGLSVPNFHCLVRWRTSEHKHAGTACVLTNIKKEEKSSIWSSFLIFENVES